MEAIKKTVNFTDKQDAQVGMQVENREQFERIKAAIRSGLESGVSNERIDDIWARAEKRVRDKKSNAPL